MRQYLYDPKWNCGLNGVLANLHKSDFADLMLTPKKFVPSLYQVGNVLQPWSMHGMLRHHFYTQCYNTKTSG